MPRFKKGIAGICRFLLIFLALLSGFSGGEPTAAAQDQPGPVKEITVAVGQSDGPFYFRDQKGHADGWLVDLWRLWSQKTGIKVKFVTVPFSETLKLTAEGTADVQGGCYYSSERAAYLEYVAPLAATTTNFFFHKNIYGIETLKDLLGFRIGVIQSDYAIGYLREHLPGASLAVYKTTDELFQALKDDELRVFVVDASVGLYFLKKWKMFGDFNYYPGKPLVSGELQAAVKKGNNVLPPLIKEGLSAITPEERAAIERRWIGMTQTKTEGVLTIACDRYYPPFTILTPSGRAAGILVDLWRLWSTKTHREIAFVFEDWEKSVQMVKEGKADIHSGLFKTKAREEIFSFSTPLFSIQEKLAFGTDQDPLTLNQLSEKRVGVIAGSAEETELKRDYPRIIIAPYNGYRELLRALQNGEILAVYECGVSLQRSTEDLGLQGEIQLSKESMPIRNLFAGVLKKNTLRLKAINRGLSEITEQEIRDIEARWVSNADLQLHSGKPRPMVLSSEEKEWLRNHPQIKLGIDPDYMPFEAFGPGDLYEGLSSSYVDILNQKLGIHMVPVKGLSLLEMKEAAIAGKLDVLPCISMTPERREILDFTRPYLDFPIVAVTRKDAPFLSGIHELKGETVAVVSGYYEQEMMEKHFPEIGLLPVDNIEQGLTAVDEGKVTAYVDRSAAAIYAIRKLGLKDLKIAVTTRFRTGFRFAVRKDWPQLAPILDKALRSIPEAEREKIANRWINVRFEDRTDWDFLLKVGVLGAVIIGLILAIILFWNRRLAREVGERKRAEERFQTLAATMPGGIYQTLIKSVDEAEPLYISQGAKAFFDIPLETVVREKRQLNWHPEDQERVQDELRSAFSAEKDVNLVGRIMVRGETKWIRVNASPSRSLEGALIYNGFILDITERKLAEQEYLNSERKIKAMSQAVDDALIMINSQGEVMFWNQSAETLFGYSAPEAIGSSFHEMVMPHKDLPKAAAGLEHFSRTGEGPVVGSRHQVTAQNRSGEEFPVELSISSFQVDDEWFAVGTVRNITERKRSEDRLNLTQNTVDKAALGIFWIDPESGRFVYANEAACSTIGYTREELLEMIVPEIDVGFYEAESPSLLQVLEGDSQVETEGVYRTKDGRLLNVLLSIVLTELENRRIIAVFARDITEQKRAEAALTESEERSRLILNSAGDGIFGVNETGLLTFINPNALKMLGFKEDELVGNQIHPFVHHHRADGAEYPVEECPVHVSATLGATHHIDDEVMWRKDGSFFPVEYTSKPIIRDGKIAGAVVTFRDITDRLKAERELKQRLEELEQFNRLVMGREEKMIGLKEEINGLLVQLGREERYKIVQ